jgi:hypothetical protein
MVHKRRSRDMPGRVESDPVFRLSRAGVMLRLNHLGTIEMAFDLGDDTEWCPIALTRPERERLALALIRIEGP